jgi:hypothetical protein
VGGAKEFGVALYDSMSPTLHVSVMDKLFNVAFDLNLFRYCHFTENDVM